MNIKRFTLAALALLTLGLASCGKHSDLSGHLWTTTLAGLDDEGDTQLDRLALLATTDDHATLFASIGWEGDPWELGYVLDGTYTMDDGSGTFTCKSPFSFTVPLALDGDHLSVDLGAMADELGFLKRTYSLQPQSYSAPKKMTSTGTWQTTIAEPYDNGERTGEFSYRYQLTFPSESTAQLDMTAYEDGVADDHERWTIHYSYSNGVGTFAMTFGGEQFLGGFYMPDEHTLVFCDGENYMTFKQLQP